MTTTNSDSQPESAQDGTHEVLCDFAELEKRVFGMESQKIVAHAETGRHAGSTPLFGNRVWLQTRVGWIRLRE